MRIKKCHSPQEFRHFVESTEGSGTRIKFPESRNFLKSNISSANLLSVCLLLLSVEPSQTRKAGFAGKHPVTGRVLVAEVLGAHKKDGAQRFLLDRSPPNAVEERLHGLPLPFAGDFVRLELGPEEVVRTSLRDGKDHYYILRQDDARIPWQAFGQPVDNDWFPDEPAVRDGAP